MPGTEALSPRLLTELRTVAAQQERERTAAAEAKARKLEAKVRDLTRQRDQWRARAAELRGHVTRYQRELAELRRAPKLEEVWK